MIVIGLSGKAESGKTSLAHLMKIVLQSGDNELEVRIVSFASALKEMAADLVLLADNRLAFEDYLRTHGLDVIKHQHEAKVLLEMAQGLTLDDLKAKTPRARRLLQYEGTEVFRKCVDDLYWVRRAAEKIEALSEGTMVVFVPDARFPNEADYVRHTLHGQVWRVERFNTDGTLYDNGMSLEARNHASEVALDDYKFDAVIDNIMLDDLFREGKVHLKAIGIL